MNCPRCQGPAEDLRGCGFNPRNLAADGTCYLWGVVSPTYTCNQPPVEQRTTAQRAIGGGCCNPGGNFMETDREELPGIVRPTALEPTSPTTITVPMVFYKRRRRTS